MKWTAYTNCDGTVFPMNQFHDSRHTFSLPPTIMRPKAIEVIVNVTYKLHCFTRDAEPGEEVKDCQIYHSNREGRLFCEKRHHLGKDLPRIMASILDRNCFVTNRANHVLFSSAQTSDGDEYAVFFVLSRAAAASPCQANVMVISAHRRQGFRPGGRPDKFRDLLRAIL